MRHYIITSISGTFFILLILALFSCKEVENPIKYENGIFTDSITVPLEGINTIYDDYNMNIHQIQGRNILVFSSNRNNSGESFDLVQGLLTYSFNQTTGEFNVLSVYDDEELTTAVINKANTAGDDFGPYRFFSSLDGLEYLILSSETSGNGLDMFYLRNMPVGGNGSELPEITGPVAISRLNTPYNEGYFSFNLNKDSVYFCSDREGDYNIYLTGCEEEESISTWFTEEGEEPVKADSVNSEYNDKTPFIYYKVMLFASDRPGGMGGYDIYSSIFKNGNWGSPTNLGPDVNTEYDEYRPVVGYNSTFMNKYIIFSSNRPEGKGGYDLYFKGISFDY